MVELYERIISDNYGDTVTEELHSLLEFYVGGQIAFAEAGLTAAEVPDIESSYVVFKECVPEKLKKYFE